MAKTQLLQWEVGDGENKVVAMRSWWWRKHSCFNEKLVMAKTQLLQWEVGDGENTVVAMRSWW